MLQRTQSTFLIEDMAAWTPRTLPNTPALLATLALHIAIGLWLWQARTSWPPAARMPALEVVLITPMRPTPAVSPVIPRPKQAAKTSASERATPPLRPAPVRARTSAPVVDRAATPSPSQHAVADSNARANTASAAVANDDWQASGGDGKASTRPGAADGAPTASRGARVPDDRLNLRHTGRLQVQTTRFNQRWASQGDVIEAWAWRHPGLAAMIKYQPPCTKDEIERRSTRCVPAHYKGEVDSSRAPTR